MKLLAIPFAWYRNAGQSLHYSLIKIGNVAINLGLNLLFLLYFPYLAREGYELPTFTFITDKTQYIFIANLIASLLTFLYMLPLYKRIGFFVEPYPMAGDDSLCLSCASGRNCLFGK